MSLITLKEVIQKKSEDWLFNGLDNTAKPVVLGWFLYRYITDEDLDKWRYFFQRTYNCYLGRYKKLLELDLKMASENYDPTLVNRITNVMNGNNSSSTSGSTSGTSTSTGTASGTSSGTSHSESSSSGSSNSNSSGSSSNSGSSTDSSESGNVDTSRNLESATPHSMVSASEGGIDAPVSWKYASGLQDSKNTSSSNSNSSNTNESTSNNSNESESNTEGSSESDSTTSGTSSSTHTGNSSSSSETIGTSSGTTHSENETTTLGGQQLVKEFYNFINNNTNSTVWMRNKMEEVFMYISYENEEFELWM